MWDKASKTSIIPHPTRKGGVRYRSEDILQSKNKHTKKSDEMANTSFALPFRVGISSAKKNAAVLAPFYATRGLRSRWSELSTGPCSCEKRQHAGLPHDEILAGNGSSLFPSYHFRRGLPFASSAMPLRKGALPKKPPVCSSVSLVAAFVALKLDSSEAAPFTLRTTMTTTGKFKIKHNFHVSLST